MRVLSKAGLLASSMLMGAGVAAGAAAQEGGSVPQETIIVTGTMLQGNATSVSPVTIMDVGDLDARGIATVQDAIQKLTAMNGPALTNSFTANGAFAGGASGASLRGLSTNSTLVLFDGMRAAYYPLADDGTRNFVDLNTIPDDIIDRVEVLRDGASSSYGADAIAGVINIITKKEFQGVSVRAETGISSRGDAAENRFSVTAGVGDLADNGVNAYISAYTYSSDQLENYQRPYPFGTSDWSHICLDPADSSTCENNYDLNAIQSDGSYAGIATNANYYVRPYAPGLTSAAADPSGPWQMLGSDCGAGGQLTALTDEQRLGKNPATGAVETTYPAAVCQYDPAALWWVIEPQIDRFGLSGHVAADLGHSAEAYLEANFMQSTVSYWGDPSTIRANAPTGIYYKPFSTSAEYNAATRPPGTAILTLPIFVCPERVDCNADNGVLNPNNPFAADGLEARIIGRNLATREYDETQNRAYRIAGGVKGDLPFLGASYDVGATAMHVDLRRTMEGYVYIQHLLDVIADGSFNFVDPASNSQDVLDYLMPTNIVNATSDQMQLQGSVSAPLFQLPGGDLEVAVGASARYEAVDSPSANSDVNGPTQRYFRLNAFGTEGERRIYSGYFEVDAPILQDVDVNLSGRYDEYSTGQDAFSPKIGVRYQPIEQVALRATYSEGFRIPSFGEANALPTTGYVNNTKDLFNDAYLAQYGCTVDTFASCPTYIRGSYGSTTLASPDLDPEESTSYTVGGVFKPVPGLTVSVDYYNIEKTGAITGPDESVALQAYYAGEAIPDGFTVIADAPDTAHATAKPRVAFVQSHLINANKVNAEGWDFGAQYDHDIGPVGFSSDLDLAWITNLSTTTDAGTQRYDGTLGNYNLTAGSGTPSWRGTWVNTVSFDKFDVSGTVNWTSGYNLSAMDQGNDYKDCGMSNGTTPCDVDDYFTYDLVGQAHVTEKATVYASVLNLTDEMPPVDVITYGAWGYNPVQGGTGILGRYYRAGVKLDF